MGFEAGRRLLRTNPSTELRMVSDSKIWTPREYLDRERPAELRSQLIGGKLHPMPPVSMAHIILMRNVMLGLDDRLSRTEWETYFSQLKVYVPAAEMFAYPDVFVVKSPCRCLDAHQDTVFDPLRRHRDPLARDRDLGPRAKMGRVPPSRFVRAVRADRAGSDPRREP